MRREYVASAIAGRLHQSSVRGPGPGSWIGPGPPDDAGQAGDRKQHASSVSVLQTSSDSCRHPSAPPGAGIRELKDRMDTCFAASIRVSYPVRSWRAMLGQCWPGGTTPGIPPDPDARGAGGVIVTPVNGRSGQGVILSQRTLRACGGATGTRGTNSEIRCAPDLNLSPKERADG